MRIIFLLTFFGFLFSGKQQIYYPGTKKTIEPEVFAEAVYQYFVEQEIKQKQAGSESGLYRCFVCSSVLGSERSYGRHLLHAHSITRHKCGIGDCKCEYKYPHRVVEHKKRVHGIEPKKQAKKVKN
jgi:hypothetical protein